MTTQPNLSLNQFGQQAIVGQLAMGIGSPPNVISAVVSANQATTLSYGQAIKFDTAVVTQIGVPPIISCAASTLADGYLIYSTKNAGTALTAGVFVEVLLGGVMWMLVEGTTVLSGSLLEDGADVGSMQPFATTGNFPRGVSLDWATSGQLFRANLQPGNIKAANAAAHA